MTKYKCPTVSYIIPEPKPQVLVPSEDGVYATLVPERPFGGNYRDYSIKSLIDANIPLEKVPVQEPSLDEVLDQTFSQITQNQKHNEN